MNEITAYYAKLDSALTTWDKATMRVLLKESTDREPTDDVLELAMHQARVERTTVYSKLRLESIEWLRSHGYTRHRGMALPPPGVLPK